MSLVIPADDDTSSGFEIASSVGVFVGLETPSSMTGTELTIQGKGADGEWRNVVKDDADYTVAGTANRIVPLRPDLMATVRELRVVSNATETSERIIQVRIRDIR